MRKRSSNHAHLPPYTPFDGPPRHPHSHAFSNPTSFNGFSPHPFSPAQGLEYVTAHVSRGVCSSPRSPSLWPSSARRKVIATATCRHARPCVYARILRRVDLSSLIVRSRKWLGFPLFTRRLCFSIEGMRCRGPLLAVALSSRTRRREAANDMMQTNDTPKPYNDTQLHSRSGRSTGCAGRPACASNGSRSIFVSRRASAPKRTPHNTNLDGGVRLRASSASSRSAWRSLPACPKSCRFWA